MEENLRKKIKDLIDSETVVLFMKGNKSFPQCGFSARAVEILNFLSVSFKDVNVLEDEEIRSGIKEYSNWPTIPQIYINQEFFGGSDTLLEAYQSGELQKVVEGLSQPEKNLS